jgi:hypothetical protein
VVLSSSRCASTVSFTRSVTFRPSLPATLSAAPLDAATAADMVAHLGLAGSFTILEFPEPRDQPIVYVGTAADDLFLEQPDELERYNVAFSNVQGAALSTALSAEFIDDIQQSLEGPE